MQQRVYQTKVQNVDDLKQCLIDLWNRMEQGVIDDAIDQWRSRLRACVQTKEGHCDFLICFISSLKFFR